MGEMDPSRVAQVAVNRGLPDARRGSGYLISAGVVLTAAHVVRDATTILVRFSADPDHTWSSSATVEFADSACDIGTINLETPAEGRIERVEFGALGRQPAVVPYSAIGFPRFKLRADRQMDSELSTIWYRDAAHLTGTIASVANSRRGTLELVAVPPEQDPDPAHSPWEGISGSAVWCGGRIVGVISEHHPRDGLNRLAATPFSAAHSQLELQRWEQLAAIVGLPADMSRLIDVTPPSRSDMLREGYSAQVEDIAPIELIDRETELDALTRFCAGDEVYQWWQADAWYGKTAVASWLVLHPPAGVRVVSFFVTGRLASQSDHTAFTRALVEQLAMLTGDSKLLDAGLMDWDAQRTRLLKKAAQNAAADGDRLLLVVDGLDEDRGAPPIGQTSIASLLPRRPPPGTRILLTSRAHPGIPGDVSPDHPLRRCRVVQLSRSDQAQEIEFAAKQELTEHLASKDEARIEILGFMTAAGGGLTVGEIAQLTGAPEWTIKHQVAGIFGRSLKSRTASPLAPPNTPPVLIFGHEALREQAQEELADEVRNYRARIDEWVSRYRNRGWPNDSPRFIFRPYARLLKGATEGAKLAELAVDRQRHDQMLHQTFGDANALEEVLDAYELLSAAAPRDLVQLIILAFEHNRLASRGESIPNGLPAAWAWLKNGSRAVALCRSITDSVRQWQALTAVVNVLIQAGEFGDAELVARSITDQARQTEALIALATALAQAGKITEAERVAVDAERPASSITINTSRTQALTAVASALAQVGQITQAERVALSISPDGHRQAEALTAVATALAQVQQITQAERLSHSITTHSGRMQALTAVVTGYVRAGRIAEAEQVALNVADHSGRVQVLIGVATALVQVGRVTEAERIALVAEQVALNVADHSGRVQALLGVATALVQVGRVTEAERIALVAERVANSITDGSQQSMALTGVSNLLVQVGQVTEAERIVGSITDDYQQVQALVEVATVLVQVGRFSEAERVSRSITDHHHGQAKALAMIATTFAQAGHATTAEFFARTLTDPNSRIQVLADVSAALVQIGRIADAERVALAAERDARDITDPNSRIRALADVTAALVQVGRVAEVKRVALDVERVAHDITDHYRQAQVLSDSDQARQAELLSSVATSLAQGGQTAAAERVALDAERIAHNITDHYRLTQALSAVATALAQGGHTAEAEQVALEAEKATQTITIEYQKEWALTAVATAFAQAGQATAAERVAKKIADPYRQSQAITDIATALALGGLIADAERVAYGIADDDDWEQTIFDIVTTLAQAGRFAEAEQVALSAARATEGLETADEDAVFATEEVEAADEDAALASRTDLIEQYVDNSIDGDHPQALTDVVTFLIQAGQIGAAEQLALNITRPDDRILALTDIAAALARTGQTADAQRLVIDVKNVAQNIENYKERILALTDIAAALARTGQTADAQRLALDAEQIAQDITDPEERLLALTDSAVALAHAGHGDIAERLGVSAILTTGWVSAVAMLTSLVSHRNGGADLARRLSEWVGNSS